MTDPIRLFVFGLGYSATALARAMKGHAAAIGGTVRSHEKAAALAAEGFGAVVFTGEARSIAVAKALEGATHILASIPPGEAGDPVLVHHRADVIAAPALAWVGYLSTLRLAAERDWQALAAECGVPAAIFRLAGIYGPGRNAFVNLVEGKAHRVVKPGQVFNRIHVEDIAAALAAALGARAAGIFNLADDAPAAAEDVVAYAADLMGVTPPPAIPFERAELSPLARSFYDGNKRVQSRIKETLGVSLRYPTYREGLNALWREHTGR